MNPKDMCKCGDTYDLHAWDCGPDSDYPDSSRYGVCVKIGCDCKQFEERDKMNYDPIDNEKTEYSLEEWAELAKNEIDKYVKEWKEKNDFHCGKHTWSSWFGAFLRYMSW